MSGKKLIIIGLLALAGIILCLVLAVVAIIGIVFLSDGCFYRYSYNSNAVNNSGIFGTDNPEDIFNHFGDNYMVIQRNSQLLSLKNIQIFPFDSFYSSYLIQTNKVIKYIRQRTLSSLKFFLYKRLNLSFLCI